MKQYLTRLVNLRPEELPRFAYLYAMFFLGTTGFIWGDMIVTAAFLQQVGVQFLPYAIVINAVVSIVLIIVYTAFADRVANDTLLIAILSLSGLGILLGLFTLRQEQVSMAYPLLYMIIKVPLQAIFNVHWATYVAGFYDTRAAKRIVPVLSSGVRFSSIIAGATIPLLNRVMPAEGVIGIWLAAVILMAAMAWLMPKVLGDAPPAAAGAMDNGDARRLDLAETFHSIREGYEYVTQSSFLKWLAYATLAMMILLAFIDYETGKIMSERLVTTQAIANFTGMLNAIANVIILPLQLFLLSRLIGWMGLGNAALLFPVSTLVTSVGLLAVPGIGAAALGHLNRSAFRTVFYNPVNSLLYNAVPLRIKGRARAFIGGLVVPLGSLLGGLLLLLPRQATYLPTWAFPAIIGALTLAYVGGMWATRQRYTQALIAMLEQEDFSFLLSQDASELRIADTTTLQKLADQLQASKSHEFTAFMAKLIAQVGGNQAVPILGTAAGQTTDGRTRAAILDALLAADLRGDAVRDLHMQFLGDEDARVRRSAITGLAHITPGSDANLCEQLTALVDDPDVEVQVEALGALLHLGQLAQSETAGRALERLLAAPDPALRTHGVRLLGRGDGTTAFARLLDHLNDPADAVRLEAILAIEARDQSHRSADGNELEAHVEALLHDPVERVRQAAVTVLGALGTRSTYAPLALALSDTSPQVRTVAVDALVRNGKAVIPTVHPLLQEADRTASANQVRKMAMVILSRINPKEFGSLVVAEIVHGNLLSIYRNRGVGEALGSVNGSRGIALLRTALDEQSAQLSDEIFYFLGALHPPDTIRVIRESLRSDQRRSRANAIEALEALTTPQTARLIAPLFEPDATAEQLWTVGSDVWDLERPSAADALLAIADAKGDPDLRPLAVISLGELGTAFRPPAHQPEAPAPESATPTREAPASGLDALAGLVPASARRKQRQPPADLFAALGGTPESTEPAPAVQTPAEPTVPQPVIDSPLSLAQIEALLAAAADATDAQVREAAQAARRIMNSGRGAARPKETPMLSTIEKIIFLKEVPFFQGMTVDQLRVLANVCDEEMFDEDTEIYKAGDPGGTLYVVVSGRVGLEQEKRTGSARLATVEAYSYFGEMNLFDNSPRTTAAVAIQDTLALRLRREPLIALARQHPDLSLELINVLSERLREANDRVAELTRTRPRELHKLFDKFD